MWLVELGFGNVQYIFANKYITKYTCTTLYIGGLVLGLTTSRMNVTFLHCANIK